jgi:hypothetical protein
LRVDARGVADLLRTQNVTDDHTLIDGVHWLPRGHALVWGEEGAGYLRTWDLEYRGARTHDADEALDGYLAAINGAIDRHSRAHGRLSLGISGGLDSRIYLAICAELGRVPECFTAGWSFYEDVRYGRKLARLAGATHAVAELDERIVTRVLPEAIIATDGLQSAAHLAPTAACWDYARQAGGVLLEGFFHGMVGGCAVPADEDVCGNVPPHATAWARGLLHTGGSVDIIDGLLRPELAEESYARWCGRIDEIHRDAPADDLLSRAEYTLVSSRRGRVDVMGTALLRDGALVRNPAADRAMVEWHQRTAPELRRGRAIYLAALRRRFPAYARVPRADGCFGLPVSTNRFWREYHWQMGKLRRRLIERHYPWTQAWGSGNAAIRAWVFDVWRRSGGLDILLDRRARVLEWVRRDALRQLWQRAVANPLEAQPILTLATLEVMLRWLDGLAGRSFEASASSQLLWSRPQSMRSPAAAPAVCAAAV